MLPYELRGANQNSNLNFAVTGADSQVAPFLGPRQWADVFLTLQIHEENDGSPRGIPQVNIVMKPNGDNISTAPVKQIQIWKKKKWVKLKMHAATLGFLA